MKSKSALIGLLAAAPLLISGCASGALFGFPIDEGDINAGRQAFLDHRCHQCHSIAGERLPPLAGADRPIFELGGETTVIRSYAELTTSIINPDHAISERYREQQLARNTQIPTDSPMPRPSLDTMSVRQLIDIVAFLDSRYRLVVEDYAR